MISIDQIFFDRIVVFEKQKQGIRQSPITGLMLKI